MLISSIDDNDVLSFQQQHQRFYCKIDSDLLTYYDCNEGIASKDEDVDDT